MLASQHGSEALRERMMDRSEVRIQAAANGEGSHTALAAGRVLESAFAWRDWSAAHNQQLGMIASHRRAGGQVQAVKRMALSMIHQKAPFEYLRDKHLRGPARHRFFHDLYGSSDYARSMVQEHRNYVVSLCSYICVDALCGEASYQRIRAYERCYTSYWQAQTSLRLAEDADEASRDRELVEYLRRATRAARERVLDSAGNAADIKTLEELRRPTGDTVRLRGLPRPLLATAFD